MKVDFKKLLDRIVEEGDLQAYRRTIAKEMLQPGVLRAMQDAGLLDNLEFHGGTAMRLVYGAPRMSEDLDFSGGPDFSEPQFETLRDVLQTYLEKTYGLSATVKEPKPAKETLPNKHSVKTWRLDVDIDPDNRSAAKGKIKIEVDTRDLIGAAPALIKNRYGNIPGGNVPLLVKTVGLDEIMARKVFAFASSHADTKRQRVRYRDFWDLPWARAEGSGPRPETLQLEAVRMGGVATAVAMLEDTREHINDYVKSKEFEDEMSRFLPPEAGHSTFASEEFKQFMVETLIAIYNDAIACIQAGA